MIVLPKGYYWPSFHWWLTLTASDQGAWVAGLGAFAAAGVALWISGNDGRRRRAELKQQFRVTAAYLYTDLAYLVRDTVYIRSTLREICASSDIDQIIDMAAKLRSMINGIRPILERTDIVMISRLPSKVGVNLSFGKGGFLFVLDEIDLDLSKIENDQSCQDKHNLSDGVEKLGPPIGNIIEFLEWFNSLFPELGKVGPEVFLRKMKQELEL